MKVRTSRFGEVEVAEETLIHLDEGILGFPHDKRFILLEHDTEDTPFKWLQSADSPDLAFVVIDPGELVVKYHFELEDDVVEALGSSRQADYIPMVIVNIPREDPIRMTANLRGPVVVNAQSRRGRQIVLKSEEYHFDHRIFSGPVGAGSHHDIDIEEMIAEPQLTASA